MHKESGIVQETERYGHRGVSLKGTKLDSFNYFINFACCMFLIAFAGESIKIAYETIRLQLCNQGYDSLLC
jgi:hypothetical protein